MSCIKKINLFIKYLLLIILSLSISVATLEILLRVFKNQIVYSVKGRKINLNKNKKYTYENDKCDKIDKVIIYSRNQLGFRGAQPPANFKDTLTIIAIGGSTTDCSSITDGKTWCDILDNKLKIKFSPIWINNAGFDGHSTVGHIVLIKDYLSKLKPKIVIFLVGANDQGLYDYSIVQKFPSNSYNNLLDLLYENIINNSRIYLYGKNYLGFLRAKRMGLVHGNHNVNELHYIENSKEMVSVLKEANAKIIPFYRKRLLKLIEISKDNSIRPVLLTQPMAYGNGIDPVTGKDLGKVEMEVDGQNGQTAWEILEIYNNALRKIAIENNAKLIDLAKEMPKNSKYFYDTYHFTNEGCQKVAEIIFDNLVPFLAHEFPDYLKITDN